MPDYLDFEKEIGELESRIAELRRSAIEHPEAAEQIPRLDSRLRRLEERVYSRLTPWRRTQIARHTKRPRTLDFIRLMMTEFVELHGDRLYGDDRAIVGGLARLDGDPVVVLGHQKGRDTKENLQRNFGMPHPEGYRKALRLMKLAERFDRAVVTFIDTPGAYPGIGAEERGQAEAIARNLQEMALLRVPIISVVTGEGGSGGALAIGVGDRLLMLQHAIYSVISPEGCAAILWGEAGKAAEAAEILKLTAEDCRRLGVVDEIVPEPLGGAHRNPEATAANLALVLKTHLRDLKRLSARELQNLRYQKYRRLGAFEEPEP